MSICHIIVSTNVPAAICSNDNKGSGVKGGGHTSCLLAKIPSNELHQQELAHLCMRREIDRRSVAFKYKVTIHLLYYV